MHGISGPAYLQGHTQSGIMQHCLSLSVSPVVQVVALTLFK